MTKNLLLKGLFSGIALLLFLSAQAVSIEEYTLTLKADYKTKISADVRRIDGVYESFSGVFTSGECIRITPAQFKTLRMTIVSEYVASETDHTVVRTDYYPVCSSNPDFTYGEKEKCTSFSTSKYHKCQKYSVPLCGSKGNYDLLEIPEAPYIKMELTSEEPLVKDLVIEESLNKEATCFNQFLEKVHCDSGMVSVKCFNENEELNNITCFMPDESPMARCKTLKVSSAYRKN